MLVCHLTDLVARGKIRNKCLLQQHFKKKSMDGIGKTTNNSHNRSVLLQNKNISSLEEDNLYHIGMSTQSCDFPKEFGDVKFVCMGGSANRMRKYGCYIAKELGQPFTDDKVLYNYASASDRYVVYKVGPVLFANHGIGIPSLSTVFHDIAKLLHHAGCEDVYFFRLGTSGGLGFEPGTVVISQTVWNGMLSPTWELPVLGKMVSQKAVPTQQLAKELKLLAEKELSFEPVLGTTICADDFFEGQARLDGAFCSYTSEERQAFFEKLKNLGVTNFEMESVGFVALCNRINIPCAVICVTLLDRYISDQITASHETLASWQMKPIQLFAKFVLKHMNK